MEKVVIKNKDSSTDEIIKLLEKEAIEIQNEDIKICEKILELPLLNKEDVIITH